MNHPAPPPVLGLVGGIAAGKSTAARIFGRWGARVVDADRLAHEVLELPEVRQELQDAFGDDILDENGGVNPDALARAAFRSDERVERMNRIVHPPILERMERAVADARERAEVPLIVVDAALLLEKELDEAYCDAVLFVDAPREEREQRVRESRGWNADELRRREQRQMDPAEKERRADYTVENDTTLDALAAGLARVWQDLTGGGPPEDSTMSQQDRG